MATFQIYGNLAEFILFCLFGWLVLFWVFFSGFFNLIFFLLLRLIDNNDNSLLTFYGCLIKYIDICKCRKLINFFNGLNGPSK